MNVDPKKMLPVIAWSPSALSAYEECPRRYQYERQMKLCPACFAGKLMRPKGSPQNARPVCTECKKTEPAKPPLEYGNLVHGEIESYIRGLGDFVPEHMKLAKKVLEAARAGYREKKVRVELELAYTKTWSPTGWFAPDAWARFKVDYAHLMPKRLVVLRDWKTGKRIADAEEYNDAMECYALGALLSGLGDATDASLVFTEVVDPKTKCASVVTTETGKQKLVDLPKLKKKWEGKVKKMFVDKRFAPKAGNCKYCPFTANNGGPCDY